MGVAKSHGVEAQIVWPIRVPRPEGHDDGHSDDVLGVVSDWSHVMQDLRAVVEDAHPGTIVVDRVSQFVQWFASFQFVKSFMFGTFHDFEGSARDLCHVAQHQDTDVGQTVMMPVINRSFVAKLADVDLWTVRIAEIRPNWFSC